MHQHLANSHHIERGMNLLAAARLANANRFLTIELYESRSTHLKDLAMFDALKALSAELKTEAEGFVTDVEGAFNGDLFAAVVKDLTDAKTLITTARANAQQKAADLKQAVTDLTAKTAA